MAQQADIEMADQFRADGKIYVVISVVLLILLGLFIYLFSLDKKVTQLEKEVSKNA
jgi:CcmD family protein